MAATCGPCVAAGRDGAFKDATALIEHVTIDHPRDSGVDLYGGLITGAIIAETLTHLPQGVMDLVDGINQ